MLRAAGVRAAPGEDALRRVRVLRLLKSGLPLEHFPLELLRTTLGWDEAFAQTISDLEAAGLTPEDVDAAAEGDRRLRDVAAVWRALDASAGGSWSHARILTEAARVLERAPERWPYPGAVLAAAGARNLGRGGALPARDPAGDDRAPRRAPAPRALSPADGRALR